MDRTGETERFIFFPQRYANPSATSIARTVIASNRTFAPVTTATNRILATNSLASPDATTVACSVLVRRRTSVSANRATV